MVVGVGAAAEMVEEYLSFVSFVLVTFLCCCGSVQFALFLPPKFFSPLLFFALLFFAYQALLLLGKLLFACSLLLCVCSRLSLRWGLSV